MFAAIDHDEHTMNVEKEEVYDIWLANVRVLVTLLVLHRLRIFYDNFAVFNFRD